MKKRIFSLFFIIFIILNIFVMTKSLCFVDAESIFEKGSYSGTSSAGGIDNGMKDTRKTAKKLIAVFISVLRVLGVGIAIIILMSLAAKFIYGSIEQKVEVKKHLIVYVTGAAVFFSASVLLNILHKFISANLDTD